MLSAHTRASNRLHPPEPILSAAGSVSRGRMPFRSQQSTQDRHLYRAFQERVSFATGNSGKSLKRRYAGSLKVQCKSATNAAGSSAARAEVIIFGGTGRIGTAAAIHLLQSTGAVRVVLAGRGPEQGQAAVREVRSEVGRAAAVDFLQVDFKDAPALAAALRGKTAVIHTAGPYMGERPTVLAACIAAGVPCYVDVADPPEYLDEARAMAAEAAAAGTMGVVCAGAFPGLSNVMAVECAGRLGARPRDLHFAYFTAGLGGSGTINLAITNFGFGDPVLVFEGGEVAPAMRGGLDSGEVEFFFEEGTPEHRRVGRREVWSWPFPEVCTVARELGISGASSVRMGTAPGVWNGILGAMVRVVPRAWWRSDAFSYGLANFSQPLVAVTDRFVGETHSIRVDVVGEDGQQVSAVHGHESFRRCVGQSAAEFTLELLQRKQEGTASSGWKPGVYLPEELVRDKTERDRLLGALTRTPGTFAYSIRDTTAESQPTQEAGGLKGKMREVVQEGRAPAVAVAMLLAAWPWAARAAQIGTDDLGLPIDSSELVKACSSWGNVCVLLGQHYTPIAAPSIAGAALLLAPLLLALRQLGRSQKEVQELREAAARAGSSGVPTSGSGWVIPAVYEDENGHSYFGVKEIALGSPTGSNGIGRLSEMLPTKGLICRETPGDYAFDWHRAPREQYIVNLDAAVEVEVEDGTRQVIPAGSMFFVSDTTGRGHVSRAVNGQSRMSLFIPTVQQEED